MRYLGFIGTFLVSTLALAALPGWVVQEQLNVECKAMARAPEVVRVQILQVDTDVTLCKQDLLWFLRPWNWTTKDLRVTARVVEVHRSRSHLKKGRIIEFSYELWRLCPGLVGPANRPQPPEVIVGEQWWVFLKHEHGSEYSFYAGASSLSKELPKIDEIKAWDRSCNQRFPVKRPIR